MHLLLYSARTEHREQTISCIFHSVALHVARSQMHLYSNSYNGSNLYQQLLSCHCIIQMSLYLPPCPQNLSQIPGFSFPMHSDYYTMVVPLALYGDSRRLYYVFVILDGRLVHKPVVCVQVAAGYRYSFFCQILANKVLFDKKITETDDAPAVRSGNSG